MLGAIIGGGMTLLGGFLKEKEQRTQSKYDERWSRYNYKLDLKNLQAYLRAQDAESGLAKREAGLHRANALLLRNDAEILHSERAALRTQIAIHDRFADAEIRAAWERKAAAVDAALLEIDAKTLSWQPRFDRAWREAETARQTGTAQLGTAERMWRELEVEQAQGRRVFDAREATLDFNLAELVGEAEVGAAARGITSDIVAPMAGARGLQEQAQERVRLSADRALQNVALAVRGARIEEGVVATTGRVRMAEARFDVEAAQLRGELPVLGARRRGLGTELDLASLERDRAMRENKLRRVAYGIEGRKLEATRGRTLAQADREGLSADRTLERARISGVESGIARWSLENVPPLPNYSRRRNRSTLGGLLDIGGSLLGGLF